MQYVATIALRNAVGYTNRDMPQEFRLIGVPFEATDGTANINKVMPYQSAVEIDWEAETDEAFYASFKPLAPHIQRQRVEDDAMGNEGTYQLYWYVDNAFFVYGDGDDDYRLIPGWCDASGAYADPEQSPDYPGIIGVNAGFWTKGVSSPFTMKFKLNTAK